MLDDAIALDAGLFVLAAAPTRSAGALGAGDAPLCADADALLCAEGGAAPVGFSPAANR
jgi:hypothetical protein